MNKVLLIGENGQVTTYLQSVLSDDYQLQVAGRTLLDLSKVETIEPVLESLTPDIIINPAAYTAVDAAETDSDAAFTINRDAVAVIASYCARTNTPLSLSPALP